MPKFATGKPLSMAERKHICVYCASSSEIDSVFFDAARQLGMLIARRGYTTVCGAGNEGLMKEVADGALAAGGEAVGIIPEFMAANGWMHKGLTRTVITPDIHTRKQRMAEAADAAVALPGGCGTMEELLEIITWKQLGLFSGTIVILNTDGFYNPLLELLENAVDRHFMKPSHRRLWRVAATPEEAIALAEEEEETATVEPKR